MSNESSSHPVTVFSSGWGAHVRGAPRAGGGMVFIGYSGSTSARGSLVAFDAETGKEAWRFWTVPGAPAKGFETPEMKRASETWTDGWSELGGGAVWEGIRYDPVTKSVFFGTAAAGPLNPNLRYMTLQAHAEWQAIVIGGSRRHLGMPAFNDTMSVEESEAIHAYVIEQAWKLYEKSQEGLDR